MQTCENRIDKELKNRLEALKILLDAYPEYTEEYGRLDEFFYWIDYIHPQTYDDQPIGWYVMGMSGGGPQDEFRLFFDGNDVTIEYWFLDWFDGANRVLYGKDKSMVLSIFVMLR